MINRPSRGQSAVEFALLAPFALLCGMVLLGLAMACMHLISLHDVARNAVRSAITADEPARAASAVAAQVGADARTHEDARTGTITVVVSKKARLPVPLLGRLLGSRTLSASATMLREPPIVLG